MYLTGREVALVADIFKVLSDSLPEQELRREVGRRLFELLKADQPADATPQGDQRGSASSGDAPHDGSQDGLQWGLTLFTLTDGENIGDLSAWRGPHRENFSDRELALLELVRPAFAVALARARAQSQALSQAQSQSQAHGVKPETASDADDAFARLTPREREVVDLVIEGLLDKEIAHRLGISYTTVRTHLDRSFQKLGVSNRSRLARIARLNGH
ncbi:MAG TPA: LuxR C-terminal-related transcriptional regulator [Paraburkholderia sp.]|jgi:RNA polymerase sigma factor (sigma-70 family)|nr:LuxR C-terminal-related transcriptional regulator [Paraburkholderia sp.]